jgi:hypothetical protein
MTKPELRTRRRTLDPEQEARIAAFSSTPDTAPEPPVAPTAKDVSQSAEESKSKGFNYRMTPSRHKVIDELRRPDERSFQWMLDKLIDLGIESWNKQH